MALDSSVKRVNPDNYKPQYVTQAFKAIRGQIRKSRDDANERTVRISNGFEPGIDLMTLVQLPAARLRHTVTFYVEVWDCRCRTRSDRSSTTVSCRRRPGSAPAFISSILRIPNSGIFTVK